MGLFGIFKKDTSGEAPTKSFWKRPEGVTGFLFAGGIIAGLGWLAWKFLPFTPWYSSLCWRDCFTLSSTPSSEPFCGICTK
jgi:hypothetical protein